MKGERLNSFFYILSVLFILLVGCNKSVNEDLSESDYGEIPEQDDIEMKLDKNI
ncbi:hypothetical protein ACTWP4_19740 [Gracilibacillus sp. D59]|uniref:hypothetical protein n=1 Tax=Gracilibacillus sp. D59 TaxID=3457434 RepID=UPI003FCE618B